MDCGQLALFPPVTYAVQVLQEALRLEPGRLVGYILIRTHCLVHVEQNASLVVANSLLVLKVTLKSVSPSLWLSRVAKFVQVIGAGLWRQFMRGYNH